jgi:hypothetical protein
VETVPAGSTLRDLDSRGKRRCGRGIKYFGLADSVGFGFSLSVQSLYGRCAKRSTCQPDNVTV